MAKRMRTGRVTVNELAGRVSRLVKLVSRLEEDRIYAVTRTADAEMVVCMLERRVDQRLDALDRAFEARQAEYKYRENELAGLIEELKRKIEAVPEPRKRSRRKAVVE